MTKIQHSFVIKILNKLGIEKTFFSLIKGIYKKSARGEELEAVTDFIFLDSKITGDGDCSHEIKRWLLLRRKAMTNPDSVLKSRRSV